MNPWKIVEENEIVEWNNFIIRYGFEKTYYSQLKAAGGSNLYALSCSEQGHAGAKVGIDTIFLVTLKDYNDDFLQNDTLNNIILANYWTFSTQDFTRFISLTDFIDENSTTIYRDVFELKLSEPPTKESDEYRFKLIFHLTNGDVFEDESSVVKIKN